MLIDEEKLAGQLTADMDEAVRSVYLLLAHAKMPSGIKIRPSGHGYIENELRFERRDRWYFSAVLNKSWVLWYFRRPAISDLGKDPKELLQIFPDATLNNKEEVKLRVRDLATAYSIIGWVAQNG